MQARSARRKFAPKAARDAAQKEQGAAAMRNDREDEFEPFHASSPTARVLDELQLYGHRPYQDEPDPCPLPDQRAVEAALADVFDALVSALSETRLEPDLEDLLWSTINLFHRAAAQVQPARPQQAEAQPDRAGRLGNPNRAQAVDRRRRDHDRAPQRFRSLPRRHRRPLRGARWHRLAPQDRLAHEPPQSDRRGDRQPRFPRRQATGRDRAADAER